MKRLLKRSLRHVVPRRLVEFTRRRYLNRMAGGSSPKFELDDRGDAVACSLPGGWTFLLPRALGDRFAFFNHSRYGRAELAAMSRLSVEARTIFDIGANIGLFSALACAANPQARVFSFEPSTLCETDLCAVRALNNFGERMSIQVVAIGEKPGSMMMLLDPWSGYILSQSFEQSTWTTPRAVEVPVETVESAARRLGVTPDFIKIDIEGFELEAIQGSLPFLERHKPALLVELHLNYLEQRGKSGKPVLEMLEGAGYTFQNLSGTPIAAKRLYDWPLAGVHFICR